MSCLGHGRLLKIRPAKGARGLLLYAVYSQKQFQVMEKKFSRQRVYKWMRRGLMWQVLSVFSMVSFSAVSYDAGQGILQKKISLQVDNMKIKNVLKIIEQNAATRFGYQPQLIDSNRTVTLMVEDTPVISVLNMLFDSSVKFDEVGGMVIFKPSAVAHADGILVSGKVTDETGAPLPGVNVSEKGTINGTITDAEGVYSLSVEGASSVLVFSSIGYMADEITVGNQPAINISLKVNVKQLEDVVVIGYGTAKRSDLVSSVSSLGKKDLESRVATSNPLLSMAAKVPGLQIYNNNGNPGGDISFNIRGFSSITGSNTPLVLVDGVLTTNLSGYAASDFETISVLKDASATAIYGARGSNGVILLTTKTAKTGEPSITYDGNVSIGAQAKKLEMLDADGYMQLFERMWNYEPKRGDYNTVIKPRLHKDYPLLFDANNNPIYNTNWQRAALQTFVSTHHYLSLTQGNDKSKSGAFLSFNDDRGLFKSDYQRKITYRIKSEYNVRKWLTAGAELNGWSIKQQIVGSTGVGGLTPRRTLIEFPAILPPVFPDGSVSSNRDWGYDREGKPSPYYRDGYNPRAQTDNTFGTSPDKLWNLRETLFANVTLLKGLDFKSTFTNENSSNLAYFWDSYANQDSNNIGYAGGNTARTNIWTSDSYFNYDKIFDVKHHFSAVLGCQWQSSFTESMRANSSGYTTEFYKYYNLGIGSRPPTVGSGYSAYSTNSYFSRLNYVYDDKYLFTLSSRYDGASMFGADNKYAFFPSGGIGWVLSKEDFFINSSALSKILSYAKVRASYGFAGNMPNSYSSLGTVSTYTYSLNNQLVKGLGVGGAPNPDLRWEKTGQLDVGAELRMFNDRISLTADAYSKKTTDLLFNVPVSLVSGYNTVTKNIGSVQNRGLEIMLFGEAIKKTDFSWDMSFVFSMNRNKVLALGAADADVISSGFLGSATLLRVGEPMGSFIGFRRLGTWGTAEEAEAKRYGKKPGDIKRLDVNDDYTFDAKDAVLLGSPFGKFDLTYSTSFRYKNWDLAIDIQVRQGNKIENIALLTVEDRTWFATGYATVLKDAWTPTNQNTMVPAVRMDADANYTDFGSYMDSHWIEDGSFIRGRSLNLNYRLPLPQARKLGMKGLRVYANLDNFFLMSNNRVFDPESSSWGGGYTGQGQSFYDTPRPRTLTLGINANF